MELRVCLAVLCAVAFLFCSVSAAGTSLTNTIIGGSQDSGLSIPQLPPPAEGSVLQRKALDSQPFIYKTSDRLLHEAEISRDIASKEWDEEMIKYTEDLNKKTGKQYSVEFIKMAWLKNQDPAWTPGMQNALENFENANRLYNAALAATDEKDYERQARIFESAASAYATIGNTKAQERVENYALAARARASAESLPLPAWIVLCGLIGGLFLILRKRE
jgi:hypothetical protein